MSVNVNFDGMPYKGFKRGLMGGWAIKFKYLIIIIV